MIPENIEINLEPSPMLNLSWKTHRYNSDRPSSWQSAEGLAYKLGFALEDIRSHIVELDRKLREEWENSFDEMPQMQLWSFWIEDDADDKRYGYDEEKAYKESPDEGHELGDIAICVFPETPMIRNLILAFFLARSVGRDRQKDKFFSWRCP